MTTVLELEACFQSKILVFLRSLPVVLFYRSCHAAEHAAQLHQFNFKNAVSHYSSLILSKFKMFDMLCHGDFYHALRSASSPGLNFQVSRAPGQLTRMVQQLTLNCVVPFIKATLGILESDLNLTSYKL